MLSHADCVVLFHQDFIFLIFNQSMELNKLFVLVLSFRILLTLVVQGMFS